MTRFTILALSGSLRAGSSNTTLLHAMAKLAPSNVAFKFYDGLGGLPHYNPDQEDAAIPSVIEWRTLISSVDGILICSPEYARGVPGSLKNALDWLVGGIDIVNKPVAVINASPHSTHAHASLMVILETMSARVIPEASITVPLRGRKLSAREIADDAPMAGILQAALAVFFREVSNNVSGGGRNSPPTTA
jgi:NAD(P)H-dependent FMN reductase